MSTFTELSSSATIWMNWATTPRQRLFCQAIDRFMPWKFEAGEALLEPRLRSGASMSTSRPVVRTSTPAFSRFHNSVRNMTESHIATAFM
jgi:hypothetical protein